jgi:hypothetical protein
MNRTEVFFVIFEHSNLVFIRSLIAFSFANEQEP